MVGTESLDQSAQNAETLFQSGKLNKAKKILEEILGKSPTHFHSLRLMGFIEGRQNNFAKSASYLSRAVEQQPAFVEGWYYLGKCFERMNKLASAADAFDRAIQLYPDFFEAHHDRGHVCFQLRRFDDAIRSLNLACGLNPSSSDSWMNLGLAHAEKKNFPAAVECFERVLIFSPGNIAVLGALANAYAALQMHHKTVAAYERILAESPGEEGIMGSIFFTKLYLGDWSSHAAEIEALAKEHHDGIPRMGPLVAAATFDSPKMLLDIAARHGATFRRKPIERQSPHKAGGKIKLAYLSADYHGHATSILMLDVLKNHDREKFEVIGISFGPDLPGDLTIDIRSAFDRFIDIREKTDHEAAELIRDMEIDIAIDLKGYTYGARPAILAFRPAPIQVNYLGFPGSMGVDFIDYLVADRFVVPEDEHAFYSESIVTLPGSYQPNGRNRPACSISPDRQSHGLPRSGFVFCSFNSPYKNNPATFDVWMNILRRVDNSVLWLLSESPQYDDNIRAEASKRDIDPARIVFAPKVAYKNHLERFSAADLFLDSLPYCAHTTASDALWADLPVVTCVGSAFAGRVGQSILESFGMPELVTHSFEEYSALAIRLATDPDSLLAVNNKIRELKPNARLFDAERYTRELETGFLQMTEIYRAGEQPHAIAVP